MAKYNPKNSPIRNIEYQFGEGAISIGGRRYPVLIQKRPSTVTIINVATTDANWTAIATGLTNVLAWKLCERNGNAFHYCFDGVGTTYVTSYGVIQRDTEITAVYAKRTGATDINLQLEVWSYA